MPFVNITKENFSQEVLSSPLPVLVDFWAPWCGYCRRISPVLDIVAGNNLDKLIFGKINVDEQPELEDKFEIMTIPTLLLFLGGKAGEPLVNPGSKAEIDNWLILQGVM